MEKQKIFVKTAIMIPLIVFSLPTTLNLMQGKKEIIYVEPQFVALGKYVRERLPPASLLVHPQEPRRYMLLPALGGVRSLAESRIAIENLLGAKTAARLRTDNYILYNVSDNREIKRVIVSNKIDYILEDRDFQIKCSKMGIMEEIYHQDGYIINKVILNYKP